MPADFLYRTQLNGRDATVSDLTPLAFAGFAHFTAMQVRDGKVRGIDLHLARLRSASLEFFGRAMPDEQVRQFLRSAREQGPGDLSLTATMFSRNGEFTPTGADDDPAILVRTAPHCDGPAGPLKLATVEHERPLVSIKHVGEATKTLYLRQAVERGFDDAAFIDATGRISEATIWNLAFWDGKAVIWPEAAVLPGITMGILRRQLKRLGVPQHREAVTLERLEDFKGAVVMNSWTAGIAVSTIDKVDLPVSKQFTDLLHNAYTNEPPSTP